MKILNEESHPDIIYNKKYKQKSLVGCGSFGSVYLVENIFTKEKFALKAVFTDSCRSIISEELDILTKLNSKYIISLQEVFNNELITFFVTEYCEVYFI